MQEKRTAAANWKVVSVVLGVALVAAAALLLTGALGGTITQPGQHSLTTQTQTTGTQSTSTAPVTNIQVSGTITTSGLGTMATQITFAGAPGNFNAMVSGGH